MGINVKNRVGDRYLNRFEKYMRSTEGGIWETGPRNIGVLLSLPKYFKFDECCSCTVLKSETL